MEREHGLQRGVREVCEVTEMFYTVIVMVVTTVPVCQGSSNHAFCSMSIPKVCLSKNLGIMSNSNKFN